MPVSVDASKTLIAGVSSLTWANRPSSANASGLYLFTDIGSSGTLMRYAGGRWRPLTGQAQLASLGAAVTGIANSETIVLQTLIPAGAWQTNDVLVITNISMLKSGTTDTGRLSVRIGTAGTTSDTVITGLSNVSVLSAANTMSGIAPFAIKLASATSAQRLGQNSVTPFTGQSSGSIAATTITDASANALYVSVTMSSSGTTDTLSMQSAFIQLLTP